jgi:hypothetical protein
MSIYKHTKKTVVMIVPLLPPAIDGVGDYALVVANQMRQHYGVDTHFLVTTPLWNGANVIDGFQVSKLSKHSGAELCELLCTSGTVILHYANYAFARWGCPHWLVMGLRAWKKNNTQAILITMFHEIYQNVAGAPWKHSFWVIPYQKHIASDLLELSGAAITNNQDYLQKLQNLFRSKTIPLKFLAVNSGIGEPKNIPLLSQRKKQIVVFGQGRRFASYRYSAHLIEIICKQFSIEKIIDIGPQTNQSLPPLSRPVIQLGEISSSRVSEILLESVVGFINYSNDPLLKSGVFAAYCAHGVLPITHMAKVSQVDGLKHMFNYLSFDEENIEIHDSTDCYQGISNNAYKWYQRHTSLEHAEIFYRLCPFYSNDTSIEASNQLISCQET